MAALDRYNTASNISLLRQAMDYGHIYDLQKLMPKVLLNTQYLAAMNPTSGSFVINPRLQRRFATLAVSFPSAEALNSIYSTFLLGTRHSIKEQEEKKSNNPFSHMWRHHFSHMSKNKALFWPNRIPIPPPIL